MWKKENLRKNFLRVKQIADQNLGRSEKSEVLTEDLLTIEKRVETVKQVCSNISKKLTSSLQAQGETVEKRLKKLPEMSIAHCLIESSALLGTGQESLLGVICQLCGDAQNNLAREQLQYEINIEKDVLMPLQGIFENDLPAILKARKHLTKTTLDMDSAKGRHTTALRQSQLPGTNMTAASAKVDQIKEELDEAEAKVEYVKDNLAVEMCSFISKETEHSQKLLALVEAQAAYHEKALKAIKAVIPRMQSAIDNNPTKPVFGNSLEEHLRVTGRDIAVVLEACVVTLLYTGMNEEGLFRIAGAASKLKKLKACFDANIVDMEEFRHDPHTVAGTLKQYLRELPEPLLTYQLYSEFMQAATLPKEKIITALKPIIERLPDKNYNNFRYLIKFLDKLSRNSDVNKMTATNIAIVIAPNLLWSQTENAPNMLTTGSLSTIIEAVVSNADYFYPEEIDFYDVGEHTPPSLSPVQPRQNQKTPDPESALAFQVNSMLTTPPSGARPVSPNPGHGAGGLSQSQGHGVSGINQNPGHGAGGLSQSQGHIVSGVVHNPVHIVTGVPGHSPSSSVGSGDITTNIFADSNSPEQPGSSPRVQRRVVKKAAPPPPPDRPYSVAVTASVSKPNTNLYQTWPRHQSAPLASPETGNPELDPLEEVSSAKPTIPERPQFPTTRQASHPPERPERPKAPPPSVPQGHNRSSSTGGMVVPPQPSPHNLSSNGQDTEDQSEGASKSITAL